jgi:hypothetical protein
MSPIDGAGFTLHEGQFIEDMRHALEMLDGRSLESGKALH